MSAAETLRAIRDEEFAPLPDNISESTRNLVSLLLEKNPEKRPDAKALLQRREVEKAII